MCGNCNYGAFFLCLQALHIKLGGVYTRRCVRKTTIGIFAIIMVCVYNMRQVHSTCTHRWTACTCGHPEMKGLGCFNSALFVRVCGMAPVVLTIFGNSFIRLGGCVLGVFVPCVYALLFTAHVRDSPEFKYTLHSHTCMSTHTRTCHSMHMHSRVCKCARLTCTRMRICTSARESVYVCLLK